MIDDFASHPRRSVTRVIPRLKNGTQLADAERRLRETATQGRNVAGGSAGQTIQIHQNSFLSWVGIVESQLRNIFIDPTTWEHLSTSGTGESETSTRIARGGWS